MARKRKGRKQSNGRIIIRTFIILFLLIVAFVAFRYYRRQAIQSEQIRQEQLAREEARQKVIRQHKAFINKIGPIAKEVNKSFELLPSITIA
ncbi:N-acetylmuramidase, partial [Lactobacillus sp. XV13L]|nr:N-acetylmuramidase [Lactobacillus sp. XV13L]